ncbi:MAG: tetratricopeptide repeat protein, partial [Chitinophagales bacterium]
LYFLLQNPSKALEDFNIFIAQHTTNLQAYNWRGTAHYELGDKEKALQDFNYVLQIDPTNKEALAYQKRIMDFSLK